MPLVDRTMYPEDQFPYGQWDYQVAYVEDFERITKSFDANVVGTVRALFRAADATAATKPSRSASIRRYGDWFGGTGRAPDLPIDTRVVTETEAAAYAAAL